MTKQNIEDLIKIRESENYTQSDIECYCDDNDIDYDEAFEVVSIYKSIRIPDYCKGCKHTAFYSKLSAMYPCNCCARVMRDMYERE